MRELSLNGYIDDESWFGDEITPESLHDLLYGTEDTLPEDVHIRLNSYGGSCNAAVRMFDDIRAYPGNVMIVLFRWDAPDERSTTRRGRHPSRSDGGCPPWFRIAGTCLLPACANRLQEADVFCKMT